MRSARKSPAIALIVSALVLSGCAGFADKLAKSSGKVVGTVVGEKIAEATPAPAARVEVDPRGGKFCDAVDDAGGPPLITDDRLNRPLRDWVGNLLVRAEQNCGPAWKAPNG